MVDIVLVARLRGPYGGNTVYHDKALEVGGIDVDADAYAEPLDRVFNVKGKENMHSEIINQHAANGLIYKIEGARKEFALIANLVDADFTKNILGNTTVAALVAATGTVTCATAIANDTVTVNGLLYTGVAGAKANNTEFSIDTSDTATALDLADSITNDTRVGTLADLTAVSALGVVTITSTAIGTAGNVVTLVSSDGATLAVSGAVLAGGVNNFDVRNIITISPELTAIRIRVKRAVAGNDATLAGVVSLN